LFAELPHLACMSFSVHRRSLSCFKWCHRTMVHWYTSTSLTEIQNLLHIEKFTNFIRVGMKLKLNFKVVICCNYVEQVFQLFSTQGLSTERSYKFSWYIASSNCSNSFIKWHTTRIVNKISTEKWKQNIILYPRSILTKISCF